MAGLHSYRRGIGPLGLMMSSVSAMIGSGFLFSALYVGRMAGPASVLSWIAGGLLVILVALTFAEVSTMLPITGGSARFPQLTHGGFNSLFFGWITWFNLMTAPAIETQALMQYAANFWPQLFSHIPGHEHAFSITGYFFATLIMIAFSVINIYSIRFITRLNNMISFWKILIPIITAVTLIVVSYHPTNFTNPTYGGFLPMGWRGVFTALASGGILFAFNGFKQSIELAGETKNPQKSILFGILGSLILVLFIYVLLQIGFITALFPSALSNGWSHLHFAGDAGPLAGLLSATGAHSASIVILYIGAILSTSAAALVFCTSAARTLYGLSVNRQLPAFLTEVNTRGMPAKAVLVNFLVGMTFFLPFHGWLAMAEFMSSIIALSYVMGPVCCLALRYQLPNLPRSFSIPMPKIWCFFSFYICTLIVYWTGWHTVSKLGFALIISFGFFIIYRIFSERPRGIHMNWRATTWLWPYLIGLTTISYCGTHGGGHHLIPAGIDILSLGILSLLCLYLSIRFRARDIHVKNTLLNFQNEIQTGEPMAVPDEDDDDL